jgi:predicted MFS family arabinose efflux permease
MAAAGSALLSWAHDLHGIALGLAVASLGFGLFRPGFTAGASLAVSRAEQGQAAGIVASVNGAAYIVAPAIGVWLYGHYSWAAFAAIIGLCLTIVAIGWQSMARDLPA